MSNSSSTPASSEVAPSSALYAERAELLPLPLEPSLLESFRIQIRVIGALIIRESLTRYGRHNIGFLWLFAEPMLFTLAATILFSQISISKDINVTEFVLAGYSTILVWRNIPSRCILALPPNYELLFHRVVKPIDIFISRCILEGIGATVSLVVLTIAFYSLGFVKLPYDPLVLGCGWFLLLWFAFSVGLLVGAISEQTEIIDKIWSIVSLLLFPLSASFFMLDSIPKEFRSILLWIPPVSCVELIREGYFGPIIKCYYDISYVIVFNLVVLFFALLQIRVVSRNVTPN